MSYNMLCPAYVTLHPELYHHCARRTVDWNERRPRLLNEITRPGADIVCLQVHYFDALAGLNQ